MASPKKAADKSKAPAKGRKSTALKKAELPEGTKVPTTQESRLMVLEKLDKLPDEKTHRLLDALANGATDKMAAMAAGMTRKEFDRMMELGANGHKAFALLYEEIMCMKAEPQIRVMEKLRDRAMENDNSLKLFMGIVDEEFKEDQRKDSQMISGATLGILNIQINTRFPEEDKPIDI